MTKAFYVTTPIYYVNDAPHRPRLHHGGRGCPDPLAPAAPGVGVLPHRYRRARHEGRAHARENNMEPQDWCDRLVENSWKPVLETIEAANDDFIRTTSTRHRKGVRKFWETVRDNGHVYEADFEGPYCVGCEEFKRPGDLVDGKCPIHDRPVEMLHESNYFFRLAQFQDALLEHYERHPTAVEPKSAYNEVVSFIKSGLEDISMSRSSGGASPCRGTTSRSSTSGSTRC